MTDESLHRKIGQYQLLSSLGKGGMGEVFLAFDPVCGRYVALKQIRPDLSQHVSIQERFLKEARIASQLTHPSIIPIFVINKDKDGIYYTMPYVEGETLKQILRTTREQEKKGEALHHIGASIPALIRIFLNVCQAIAYTHSRGVLHRDLKPENIIVGKYGEVLILDWGLADMINNPSKELEIDVSSNQSPNLTRPGKIVGTLTYLPPERVLGEPSSVHTDIYSLGVILYQLLTLRLPFQRNTISSFKKQMKHEKLIDPAEAAPYRDIPHYLSDMVKKCLDPEKQKRYQNVEELIADLENYIEGRPEWIFASELKIQNKNDWEFQENVLLAKHIAITRQTDVMEWVSLMISRASFPDNIRIEAEVRLGTYGSGLGFLLGIPEASERKGVEDGYCLWIASSSEKDSKFFRSHIEIMKIPEAGLIENRWTKIRIEKTDSHLRFFQDDRLKFNYISHVPMTGTQVGLLYRDGDFEIRDFKVYVGSQNVMVNCLAVPDAFLAAKNFNKALAEYRRIGRCFPGRAEGREALFRAGITLLEEASFKKNQRKQLLLLAFEEFGKLRQTPGAPLEYLGKSLVYKEEKDTEEEIKCLELAIRKYPKHPLLPILEDHIAYRLHEASHYDRLAAYHFALLCLRHLPNIFSNPDNQRLIESLEKHLEPLAFIYKMPQNVDLSMQNSRLAIQLAFWLAKPITLVEILETSSQHREMVVNALFSLLELGCTAWVREHLFLLSPQEEVFKLLTLAIDASEKKLPWVLKRIFKDFKATFEHVKVLAYLFEIALRQGQTALFIPYLEKLDRSGLPQDDLLQLNCLLISAYLLKNDWQKAKKLLYSYTMDMLNRESSPLYYLFGCFLRAAKGEKSAIKHFRRSTETQTPSLSCLLACFLSEQIDLKKGWLKRSFFWERVQLFSQLLLFYHCAGQKRLSLQFQKRLNQEWCNVQPQ
ncbi:MAG: serine/threonine-protein kinase PknD [Anaerolineae bacterium]